MKKFRLRKFHFGFITFFILIYMEVVSRILTHVSIFNNSIWYVLIFSLFITILFHGLGKIFNRSVNKVLFLINIFLLALLYSMQLCVFKLFSFYFDWGLIGATDQVASFAGDGLMVVLSNAIGVLLFMLPFFVLLIFNHIIVIEKESIKANIIKVVLSVLVYFIFIFSLNISKNDAYELYYKVNNVSLNIEKFGVLHTFLIDSYRSVFGFKESVSIINKDDGDMSSGSIPRDEIIYGYNNLDIDFNKLIKNEVIEKNKLEFPKGLRYEDIEFTYKMIPHLTKTAYVDKCFVHYVQRDNSIANVQNSRTAEIFTILDDVIKYYKENGFYEEYKAELEYNYARYLLCSSLKRICKVQDKVTRKKLINETWNKLNSEFPNWKKNKILNTVNIGKNKYMRTINKFTYKIYATIFSI